MVAELARPANASLPARVAPLSHSLIIRVVPHSVRHAAHVGGARVAGLLINGGFIVVLPSGWGILGL